MKKILFVAALLGISAASYSQAIRDRNVVPVAVNLNQVLRMTITNGGNIEFVFNTIDQYKLGLGGGGLGVGAFYQTDFVVASSTRWELTYGSETATFIGTDNPGNIFPLDNVGFEIVNNGAHNIGAADEMSSPPTADATVVADLDAYPVVLLDDNGNASANAGDETDNSFSLLWRCGTAEGDMNAVNLIDQNPSPQPDRYVSNVLFELAAK
ncbi:MAG: hypothetical protein DRI54_09025 [Bacteroidetes bacterium]|nr:MAG: hypothetical protein DRI54_09025 [Bacteroidota bacterium]